MTTAKDNGGLAFPISRESEGWYEPGMTLRDWFAGMALQGALAGRPGSSREMVEFAFHCADLMIEARKS